eukprot:scaffold261172_cov22-Tisochrysis_lutea.AAC.1
MGPRESHLQNLPIAIVHPAPAGNDWHSLVFGVLGGFAATQRDSTAATWQVALLSKACTSYL